MTLILAALLTALLSLAAAAPTPSPFHPTLSDFRRYLSSGVSDEAPFPLADSSPFVEPVYFSQAAFCDPHPGDVIRGTNVVWRGGNGQDLPTIFIAYSDEKGIIISNQGTNVSDARSIEIVSVTAARDGASCSCASGGPPSGPRRRQQALCRLSRRIRRRPSRLPGDMGAHGRRRV